MQKLLVVKRGFCNWDINGNLLTLERERFYNFRVNNIHIIFIRKRNKLTQITIKCLSRIVQKCVGLTKSLKL